MRERRRGGQRPQYGRADKSADLTRGRFHSRQQRAANQARLDAYCSNCGEIQGWARGTVAIIKVRRALSSVALAQDLLYFIFEGGQHIDLGDGTHDFPFAEDDTLAIARGKTDVG